LVVFFVHSLFTRGTVGGYRFVRGGGPLGLGGGGGGGERNREDKALIGGNSSQGDTYWSNKVTRLINPIQIQTKGYRISFLIYSGC